MSVIPLAFLLLVILWMIPWYYEPKRGTRSLAALTGYRWGFTPVAVLPMGLILWGVGRFTFADLGTASNLGLPELRGIFYGFIGQGIAVVIGIIAAIVCGVRHKPTTGPECEHCGYSLKGLVSTRCPECGAKT